jgi:hypothetical protein
MAGKWYAGQCAHQQLDPYEWETAHKWLMTDLRRDHCMGNVLERRATELLEIGAPYDEESGLDTLDNRFEVSPSIMLDDTFRILDRARCISMDIARNHLEDPEFNLIEWYGTELLKIDLQESPSQAILSCTKYQRHDEIDNDNTKYEPGPEDKASLENLNLASIQVDRNRYPHLQGNAASVVKGNTRILHKPAVPQVKINGHPEPERALVDTGSLRGLMSSKLADQVKIKKSTLHIPLQLAPAKRSRSKVNLTTEAGLQCQNIDTQRYFEITDHPARIIIGRDDPELTQKGHDTKLMVHAMSAKEQALVVGARADLQRQAESLCRDVYETDLPPLRDTNHGTIPLIDELKICPRGRSKYPKSFRSQWAGERKANLESGRREVTSSGNKATPELKMSPPQLRTVIALE